MSVRLSSRHDPPARLTHPFMEPSNKLVMAQAFASGSGGRRARWHPKQMVYCRATPVAQRRAGVEIRFGARDRGCGKPRPARLKSPSPWPPVAGGNIK